MIRKATVKDVKKIQKLIGFYAKRNRMLPRSLNELYENIRDFNVDAEGARVNGCCALHVDWDDLAEIKSLAVSKPKTGAGVGANLIMSCLREAKELKVKKVFALTYIPDFFKRFGFKVVNKDVLPHKIWSECIKCVYFPKCKEIAVMKQL